MAQALLWVDVVVMELCRSSLAKGKPKGQVRALISTPPALGTGSSLWLADRNTILGLRPPLAPEVATDQPHPGVLSVLAGSRWKEVPAD